MLERIIQSVSEACPGAIIEYDGFLQMVTIMDQDRSLAFCIGSEHLELWHREQIRKWARENWIHLRDLKAQKATV